MCTEDSTTDSEAIDWPHYLLSDCLTQRLPFSDNYRPPLPHMIG